MTQAAGIGLLDTLRAAITSAARRNGVPVALADVIAASADEEIRRVHGGGRRYVPAVDKRMRDRMIVREFNGGNRDDLCRRYGLSRPRLYAILGENRNKPSSPRLAPGR